MWRSQPIASKRQLPEVLRKRYAHMKSFRALPDADRVADQPLMRPIRIISWRYSCPGFIEVPSPSPPTFADDHERAPVVRISVPRIGRIVDIGEDGSAQAFRPANGGVLLQRCVSIGVQSRPTLANPSTPFDTLTANRTRACCDHTLAISYPSHRSPRVIAVTRQQRRMRDSKAHYAATRSAPPDGTRSKGSRTLTIVPVPSDLDETIVPPS